VGRVRARDGIGRGLRQPLAAVQRRRGAACPQIETLIEFSHRLTSGLAALLVLALVIWGFRVYGRGHVIRKSLVLCGILMILEALIGAGLVCSAGWPTTSRWPARSRWRCTS
jgi:heme A synthase